MIDVRETPAFTDWLAALKDQRALRALMAHMRPAMRFTSIAKPSASIWRTISRVRNEAAVYHLKVRRIA